MPNLSNFSFPQLVVLIFGALIVLLSIWSIALPGQLRRWIKAITDTTPGYVFAAAVRLGLGIALVLAAPTSRFPLFFWAIGVLAILAAIGILLMGRGPLRTLVAWFDGLRDTTVRLWLILALAFGAFLIYGAS